MAYKLGERSLQRLVGVHPDLVKVVKRAIELTPVDFTVLEGVRTLERQKELFNKVPKVTNTMQSKHLKQKDGHGHAVDLGPLVNGVVPWDDFAKFKQVSEAMFTAAKELGVNIKWGGNFSKLKDGPHFEISL